MSERSIPPFRADQVGSLLRPPELLHARAAQQQGKLSREELRRAEDTAIAEAVRRQEELSLLAVTDGEFRRTWFHLDFLEKFANVDVIQGVVTARFHTHDGDLEMRPPAVKVVGKITRPRPIFVDDFKYLQSIAHVVPKLTLPSPSMMHFRGGRRAIDESIYPDMAEFYTDLARAYAEEIRDLGAAGCRYLQLDEVNLA
jgi:5-methyltetrahydropteroyltriglutamate--homocysteine methyltransferase